MAIPDARAMRFTPTGLSDAFDATMKFEGACQYLQNLVFDQANPELVVSRPGVTLFTNLRTAPAVSNLWGGGEVWGTPNIVWGGNSTSTFANPTFISIQQCVGDRIYGMVATSRNPGHDEPFCYDILTGTFITISDVAVGNTPFSPPQSGEWTPPTLTVVGTMIVITHPGFSGVGPMDVWGGGKVWGDPTAIWGGGANYYGIIDVTDFNNPSWRAENTAVNPLTSVPQAVANFNNRAYFAVKNELQYTDDLTNPLTRTNASQALTIGDTAPINALAGLPIQTTSSGVVQSLTAFKKTQVWQITGDTTTFNLAQNYVSLNIGTTSPRSVVQAPYGIYFIGTGGPYIIDLLGTLRSVTHGQELEPDIQIPFQNAINPTRWSAAYNSSIYRICGETVLRGVQQFADFWFDEHRRRWTGPHTFSYDCATYIGDGHFILSSVNYPGLLIHSAPRQDLSAGPTDLDTQFDVKLLSATFPKVDPMSVKQVAESQIELSTTAGNLCYDITAQNDQGETIGHALLCFQNQGKPWGSFVWGDGTLWGSSNLWGGGKVWGAIPQFWGGGGTWGQGNTFWTQSPGGSGAIWGAGGRPIPRTGPVPWSAPLVFEKMQLQVTAPASLNLAIGTFYARYQRTGYMTLGT